MAVTTTFYGRALANFQNRAGGAYRRGMGWYRNTRASVRNINEQIVDWVTEHRKGIIIGIGIVVFIGVTLLFIWDWWQGNIENATQVGIGGLIGGPLLGLIIGAISAVLIYLSLWLIDRVLLISIYLLLLAPILIGAIFYGIYLILMVFSQFILLVPLSILVFMNGLWLLWRRIFYTCPTRGCSYRGLPIYVCPKCARQHPRLWPNLQGLFHHPCQCGQKLPTLDLLGRNRLVRLCASCKTELSATSIGKLSEEFVALVGGPDVGKTTFLLMSTHILLNGVTGRQIRAEIDVPRQKKELDQELANLRVGILPAKTDFSLIRAYQFRLNRSKRETLLYYYDAAGEEFSSIDRFGRHENVKHLNGLILLVDPFSLPGLQHETAKGGVGLRASPTALDDVVAAMVGTMHRLGGSRGQLSAIPLAVVITKADAKPVQIVLGDISHKLPTSPQCNQALQQWGAGNALRVLQQNFKTIHYFACSALGRTPQPGDNKPFQAYGVLEPLLWILKA